MFNTSGPLGLNTSVSRFVFAVLAVMAAFSITTAFAASSSETAVHWWNLAMTLFGGLALFLFGMEQMADALKAAAGERLKLILAKLTTNRFMGAATGAFVTAIIQSSSVTTVLVVGFITAGLMSVSQSIGVIMGANIGTTITAQIVAFKVTKFALLMVAVGFAMLFSSKDEKIKQYGNILMGLGLVFFGMSVMSGAMNPLRSYQPFLDLMTSMENPIVGILVAAVFTGLIQSSSATTGIVIVMATQGFITLEAGIALAFGSNIGTCVTAMLASIGKPREAVRAAVVHVLFNVFGVLIWLGLITQLAEFVTWLSPASPELTGTARLAAEAPRQIANAHTIFNLVNTLVFIGFTGQFAWLVEKLVPDRPLEEVVIVHPKYINQELLNTPSLALELARLEIGHMGDRVINMLQDIMPAIVSADRVKLNAIASIDDEVDYLHGQIVTYLGQVSRNSLTYEQTLMLTHLMAVANDLENIGDTIETDLVYLGFEGIANQVSISDETRGVLNELHQVVLTMAQRAIHSVIENDQEAAREVIEINAEINVQVDLAAMHESKRLVADEPNRLAAYTLEIDIIEKFQRIYYFAKRMAKSVNLDKLPEAVEEVAEDSVEETS